MFIDNVECRSIISVVALLRSLTCENVAFLAPLVTREVCSKYSGIKSLLQGMNMYWGFLGVHWTQILGVLIFHRQKIDFKELRVHSRNTDHTCKCTMGKSEEGCTLDSLFQCLNASGFWST